MFNLSHYQSQSRSIAEDLKIFSQNCQGLANPPKRRGLFRHIRCKNYNIISLQNIHIESSFEPYVKVEWGSGLYASPFRNNSRGVMILINNKFEYKVERVETDPNGNFIILDIKMRDKRFILVNLYGPNEDKPQFFYNIRQKLVHYESDLTILCGDWNLVTNPDIDTYNYLHINNPRAKQF